MPRETLVIELNCKEAVGSDKKGEDTIAHYVDALAKILERETLHETVTHLSPLYGLSGWAPLPGSAIHIYAWDHENEPHAPFVSVDVSTETPLDDRVQQTIIDWTAKHFQALPEEVVYKTNRENGPGNWREIADNILRQRLSLSGHFDGEISGEEVGEYMKELSTLLNMSQLSEPLIHQNNAWMHWETSGTIAAWDNEKKILDIDIYTCKAFLPADAINYTKEKLKLQNLTFINF